MASNHRWIQPLVFYLVLDHLKSRGGQWAVYLLEIKNIDAISYEGWWN